MTKTFTTESGDHFYLLAAAAAVAAAIFMVAVWGPLQARAFTQAAQEAPPEVSRWDHIPFVTADGNTTDIAASNGQVRVVTMIYTHCPGVCPLALSTLQRVDRSLTATQRGKLSILALSLDPAHDSVASMREFRTAHGIASPRWIFARPSLEGAQALAAALGITYRLIGDDAVDHQSVFVLLGKSGQMLARSSNTRGLDPKFASALQSALNGN